MEKFADVKKISEAAYRFLTEFEPEKYEDGHYDLEDGVFVNIMTYETKLRKDAFYEAHRNYIDIQMILNGAEIISAEPLDVMHKAECLMAYDPEKDAEFYANNFDGVDSVFTDGQYGIYMPQDGHMPGICVGGPAKVRKAVVKVPVK